MIVICKRILRWFQRGIFSVKHIYIDICMILIQYVFFYHTFNKFGWIIRRKFEQWWSRIPQISIKPTITSPLNLMDTKKYHDIWRWKSSSCLMTEAKDRLMGFQSSPLNNWISNRNAYIYKQAMKHQHRFSPTQTWPTHGQYYCMVSKYSQ
jgi:hypothetical protein